MKINITDKSIENLTYEQIETIFRQNLNHLISISKDRDSLLVNMARFWSDSVELLRKAN